MIRSRMMKKTLLGGSLVLALAASGAVRAAERDIAGPVAADVVKVRDGDTIEVEAHIWPQQIVRVAVRLRGIDAPELKARCAAEKLAALAAKARLAALLAPGGVTLTKISGDKYFGRVLAEISAKGGADIAATLLREGLVVRYGGAARRDWCDGAPLPRGAAAGEG
jgi:endonuclease YncB( thermonuclease family)